MGSIKCINPMINMKDLGFRVEIIISNDGFEITSKELTDKIRKFRPYIEVDNGGVLFKGDICSQLDFVIECCNICKKAGINTCLETKYTDLYIDKIRNIDLLILDINEIPLYNKNIEIFINSIHNTDIWIRQMIYDSIDDINSFYKKFKNIKKVEYIHYEGVQYE